MCLSTDVGLIANHGFWVINLPFNDPERREETVGAKWHEYDNSYDGYPDRMAESSFTDPQ